MSHSLPSIVFHEDFVCQKFPFKLETICKAWLPPRTKPPAQAWEAIPRTSRFPASLPWDRSRDAPLSIMLMEKPGCRFPRIRTLSVLVKSVLKAELNSSLLAIFMLCSRLRVQSCTQDTQKTLQQNISLKQQPGLHSSHKTSPFVSLCFADLLLEHPRVLSNHFLLPSE